MGPGAIGSATAARLLTAGRRIAVASRAPFGALEVATIDDGVLGGPVTVFTEPDEVRSFAPSWVLVATKAYDADATARWLEATPGAAVAVLQNGVEHVERFSRWVSADRIVPVVVDFSVARLARGSAREGSRGRFVVPATRLGAELVELMAGSGVVMESTSDFVTAAWRKLALNVTAAVSAVTLLPNGIARDEAAAPILLELARECVEVGRREGAALDDAVPGRILERLRASTPDSESSLLRDRRQGSRLEVDARNGAVVRIGARHGIATPMNSLMVALLGAIERSFVVKRA